MTSLLHTPKLQLVDMAFIKASKEEHAFNVGEVFNKMSQLSNDITIVGNDGEKTVVNRLLLGVCSPTLRPIILDQLNMTPTILLPDMSSSTVKHLVNLVTVGSSIAHTIAFKELHEITEAAKILGIDLTDIAWESIQYKPKVVIKQVKDIEASEIDDVCEENGIHNITDENNGQSYESGDKAIVKVDQSSINSTPLGTNEETFLISDQAEVNDKKDVQHYQDTNMDHNVDIGVMDDQSDDNVWKNKAITDDKIDIEVMDDQDIGEVMDYQPNVMGDEVNDAIGQDNVSFKDDLVTVMDNGADNQISANIADNPGNVNVPEDQIIVEVIHDQANDNNGDEQVVAIGDHNNTNTKNDLLGDMNDQNTVMDDQNIVRIMDDEVTVIDGLTNADITNEQSRGVVDQINVNLNNDQVGAMNDQDNVVSDQTIVKLKDNVVGVMSPSMDDQADVKNYQTCGDVMSAQVSANDMDAEASISTDQTSVIGEPSSFMDEFIDDEASLTRDQSDSDSPMGDQSNFMDNETPIMEKQTIEHNQVELKYDPARIDTLYQNNVYNFTGVKNAEINIKNEKISFEICSPFKNDLVKGEVRVKNEVVENLIKEDNNMDASFNSLNEFDNSFEAVHETSVSISDKNLKTKIEPVKDDNNFESSFNSVSDFDSSFETHENSMDMSDESAALKTVCQVCSKEENNYSILKTHYVSHFTTEMKSQFGDQIVEKNHGAKKYQYCVVCNARFTSMRMALRHIGISHNKLNEILIYEGLTPLPDNLGGASKRKAEKEEELIKKIKTEPVQDIKNLLSDGNQLPEINIREESTKEIENSKPHFEGLKVNDHNIQEESVKIDKRIISDESITGEGTSSNSVKLKEEKKNEANNMLKIEGAEKYKENHIEDEIRAEEMVSEVADSSVCQICQKTENPGLSLWNHYINSHYSSKRIVQEFGNLVRKKKCLVCNSKHSGTAAALKHVAVKHEKLNDLLILDGLVPLPAIGSKAAQEFSFRRTVKVEGTGQSKHSTVNIPVPENVSNNHELKPFKISATEEQQIVHNEELMVSKKPEVDDDTDQTSVETSTRLTDSSNNDDEIENDDVKDPLVCQICNLKKSSILLLQKHYINSHYTRKIKSRFEHLIDGNYCENCDIEFRSTIQALIHVGIEHNKLNEILDEEGYLVLLAPKEEVSEVKSLSSKTVESEDSEKEKPNHKTENIVKVDLRHSKMLLEHNKIETEDNFKKQITEKEEFVSKKVDFKKEITEKEEIVSKKDNFEKQITEKEEVVSISMPMPSHATEVRNKTLNTNPLAKFTCDVCSENFDKKNNFIRHTLSNRHYFTCDNCETNFRKKDKFDTHTSVCPAMKEEAKNVFKNNSDDKINNGLDQHKKLATEPSVAHDITKPKVAFKEPAPVMKIKTDPASNYGNIEPINQMRTERKRTVTVTEITCEICGEKFNNKKIFFRHCLTKNHYFTCEVCGKSFKKRVEYTAHQQNCTM